MKIHLKLLALFLMLLMVLQSTAVTAFAIVPVEFDTGIYQAAGTQPSKYSSQYNSGQRDVVATTLSGTSASSYYTGSYAYNVLSEKSASEIKSALSTLMKNTHTYTSSYNDCHYKADRTDCENQDGRVSLIYTKYSATMSQWNGWNREHVWPQSLGGGNTSGGGADLHHIRPSDAVVNSTRGNKKYGNTNGGTAKYGSTPATGYLGGYYNPTYFEPVDSVKGDVARICLYVYVRWGSTWGADSITEVFQSVDVLLEWCALDPVDTWELGRNEVVQDIQGNRNVFIDYPEYAWLIFGEEVPASMTTPSGKASEGGCDHVGGAAATCTTPQTCTICGTTIVDKLGHSFGNWIIDKEATETEPGSKHRICATCEFVETLTVGHEHKYESVVTPPSCTNEGYTTHTCSCGYYYVDSLKDYLDHNYQNGFCSSCGAHDPDAPSYTKNDFVNLINALANNNYSGESQYNKICEAVNIYNFLSADDKVSVSEQYNTLVSIVNAYNGEVNSANESNKELNDSLSKMVIVLTASLLSYAAYTLLNKKYL